MALSSKAAKIAASPKKALLLKRLGIGLAGAGAIGGAGIMGHNIGVNRMGENMSGAFKAYNAKENEMIARHFSISKMLEANTSVYQNLLKP